MCQCTCIMHVRIQHASHPTILFWSQVGYWLKYPMQTIPVISRTSCLMQCSVHVSMLVVNQLVHALSDHLKFCNTLVLLRHIHTSCNTCPLVQLQHWLDFVRRSQKPSRFSLAPPPPYQLPQAQNSSFVLSLSPLSTIPWASTSVTQYIHVLLNFLSVLLLKHTHVCTRTNSGTCYSKILISIL